MAVAANLPMNLAFNFSSGCLKYLPELHPEYLKLGFLFRCQPLDYPVPLKTHKGRPLQNHHHINNGGTQIACQKRLPLNPDKPDKRQFFRIE